MHFAVPLFLVIRQPGSPGLGIRDCSQLADLFSALPEFATFVGEHNGGPVGRLIKSQELLGPLLQTFTDLLPEGTEWVELRTSSNRLLKEMQDTRKLMLGADPEENEDKFENYDLALAADLLIGILKYEPKSRLAVKQALEHDFYKIARLQ